MTDTRRYVVVCDDYISQKYATREGAERNVEATKTLGACKNEHRIVEVRKGEKVTRAALAAR